MGSYHTTLRHEYGPILIDKSKEARVTRPRGPGAGSRTDLYLKLFNSRPITITDFYLILPSCTATLLCHYCNCTFLYCEGLYCLFALVYYCVLLCTVSLFSFYTVHLYGGDVYGYTATRFGCTLLYNPRCSVIM